MHSYVKCMWCAFIRVSTFVVVRNVCVGCILLFGSIFFPCVLSVILSLVGTLDLDKFAITEKNETAAVLNK